jgi:hypothetical protein
MTGGDTFPTTLVAAALLAAPLLRPAAAGDRHARRRNTDRAPAQSREEPTMDDVRAVQDRFDRAELTADRDALRELIADDFRSIGPRGFVMDKEQWIGRHGEFRYERLDTSDMDVRRYGDTAVVRDVQRNRATYQDHPVAVASRVSQVWVRLDGRWQLVAIQFSPLPDEPATLPEEARR